MCVMIGDFTVVCDGWQGEADYLPKYFIDKVSTLLENNKRIKKKTIRLYLWWSEIILDVNYPAIKNIKRFCCQLILSPKWESSQRGLKCSRVSEIFI